MATTTWDRKVLKERGKAAFKRSYWKSVFAAFFLAAAAMSFSSSGGNIGALSSAGTSSDYTTESSGYDTYDYGSGYSYSYGYGTGYSPSDGKGVISTASSHSSSDYSMQDEMPQEAAATVLAAFAGVLVIAIAVGIALSVFILLPIEVGGRRYFTSNLSRPARAQELLWAFDSNYMNIVKVMFLRDLKILGWTLLFIVPGIVKSYEYRMIPYLIAENPALTSEEVTAESRKMMDGNKWGAFVLDLSFIGWDILSAMTLGLVGVFYSNPYHYSTTSALFEVLRYGDSPSPVLPESSELPESPVPPTSSPYAAAPVPPAYPTNPSAPVPPAGMEPEQNAGEDGPASPSDQGGKSDSDGGSDGPVSPLSE